MTSGTFSNIVQTGGLSTTCHSSNSIIRNGFETSWTGVDSAVRYKPKPVDFLGRVARFYVKERYPNLIDLTKTIGIAQKAERNIFDASREKRFHYPAESPSALRSAQGDYGVPHPYSKTWTGYRESVFGYSLPGFPNNTGTVASCGLGPGPIPSTWGPEEEYKLLARLRAKIVGNDFNVASFLGAEGRDTVRFLGDTANRIYRAQLAMRRADVNAAYQILRDWGRGVTPKRSHGQLNIQRDIYQDLIDAALARQRRDSRLPGFGDATLAVTARQWLQYHLAIEPLLGDVRAAAEQLAHMLEGVTPPSQKMRTSVRKRDVPTLGVFDTRWGVNFLDKRVGIVAYFTMVPDQASFLGFADPEVTIWNAIPLTFVSDYVLPIGNWLEAWATRRTLPTALYVRSEKNRYLARNLQRKAALSVFPDDGLFQAFWSGSFTRTISQSLDVPLPRVIPLGHLKSWQRAATLGALIVSSGSDRVRYS